MQTFRILFRAFFIKLKNSLRFSQRKLIASTIVLDVTNQKDKKMKKKLKKHIKREFITSQAF